MKDYVLPCIFVIKYMICFEISIFIFPENRILAGLFFANLLYWDKLCSSVVAKGKRLADKRNRSNPLFERGCFRKEFPGGGFFADLKGFYYCQIVSLIPMVAALGYAVYDQIFFGEKYFWIEKALEVSFLVLLCIRIGLNLYYLYIYVTDFRYTKNKRGIWMPFSNIAQPPWKNYWGHFRCQYNVEYEQMKRELFLKCKDKGYSFAAHYDMKGGEEAHFFLRTSENGLRIFAFFHIKEFSDDYFDKFNLMFEKLWQENIEQKMDTECAGVFFLLCVDENNRALQERLNPTYCIDQKKGKNRLAATLVYSEGNELNILDSYKLSEWKSEFIHMRRELVELLGLSWKYDKGVYPEIKREIQDIHTYDFDEEEDF